MTSVAPLDWQPEDPATLADPYPLFARLREEDPCHWSSRLRSWVITRYDDVKAMCLDREGVSSDRLSPFFSALPGSEATRIADIIRYLSLWMVFKDPPQHTRLRRLTGKVFSTRSMQAMRPQAERLCGRLLRDLADRDRFDLVADFAGPLPCLVIMTMLGVPESDLPQVKRLSDDIALFIGSSRTSAQKYDTAEAATREMAMYFRGLMAARREHPREDALSELVHLREGGDAFSDDELVATCMLMLFAGHETTTNHIANGLRALMQFPAQWRRWRDDPSLTGSAIEELLRFDGPSATQVRIVTQARRLHGRALEPGQRVFMILNAANRDPRAYPDPDRLDLARDGVPHLAFGFGAHLCLGFPLARMEGAVALDALMREFTHIEPAGEPTWINSIVFRGMSAMPVAVRRA